MRAGLEAERVPRAVQEIEALRDHRGLRSRTFNCDPELVVGQFGAALRTRAHCSERAFSASVIRAMIG